MGPSPKLLRVFSLALVLAVLAYLWWRQPPDLARLVQRVGALPLALWPQLLGLVLLSYAARFLRWNGLLRRLGHRVPPGRQLLIYLAGFSMALSPGKAGETLRSLYLQAQGVPLPHSLAAFIADRLFDLLSVGLLALMGLGLAAGMAPSAGAWTALALVLLVVAVLRSRGPAWLVRRWCRADWARHIDAGLTALSQLLAARGLAWALPLSALAWVAQGLGLWLCLEALGQDLIAWQVIALYGLALLAGAASLLPGGLGATEAVLVLLLQQQGAGATEALIAAVVGRGLPLWTGLAMGLLATTRLAVSMPTVQENARPNDPHPKPLELP